MTRRMQLLGSISRIDAALFLYRETLATLVRARHDIGDKRAKALHRVGNARAELSAVIVYYSAARADARDELETLE